jgi:dipeptidyl aminopeptidase/acylaminoacyl peptidase
MKFPLYQAEMFVKRSQEVGAPIKLHVKPGADHGWAGMDKDMGGFAQWFNEHLLQNSRPQTSKFQ